MGVWRPPYDRTSPCVQPCRMRSPWRPSGRRASWGCASPRCVDIRACALAFAPFVACSTESGNASLASLHSQPATMPRAGSDDGEADYAAPEGWFGCAVQRTHPPHTA